MGLVIGSMLLVLVIVSYVGTILLQVPNIIPEGWRTAFLVLQVGSLFVCLIGFIIANEAESKYGLTLSILSTSTLHVLLALSNFGSPLTSFRSPFISCECCRILACSVL